MMNDDTAKDRKTGEDREVKFDREGYKIEKPDLSMFNDLPDFDVNKEMFDVELDTSGQNCPLPIIKAKKELKL